MSREPTARLWANAMKDAQLIMGRVHHGPGRRPHNDGGLEWKAEDDPLAWWCLVEVLVAYAQGKKS